ncbi:MAG: carbon-nitrogen hydrolase family protein, partial [Eubacterium sp.]|nr:carbon-nitrogen hydrolase family protein [Eubacterium sp.]
GNIEKNYEIIKGAIEKAANQDVDMIIFPECALSGYPSRDYPTAKEVDYRSVSDKINELKELSDRFSIGILVGTAAQDDKAYDRVYFIAPGRPFQWYDKRALCGKDAKNFSTGSSNGVFEYKGHSIGVRICCELRFPEYFRELYKAHTDYNVVLFNDVSEKDDSYRYRMIKSHMVTRAVENVTPTISVNSSRPYQTAPSCFLDASGNVLAECKRNKEGMVVYEYKQKELNSCENSRKKHSDSLLGI